MQEKSKIHNIHGKSTNSPSNQAIWMTNTNPPPSSANQQIEKNVIYFVMICFITK
jgi:hypothetical protein